MKRRVERIRVKERSEETRSRECGERREGKENKSVLLTYLVQDHQQ